MQSKSTFVGLLSVNYLTAAYCHRQLTIGTHEKRSSEMTPPDLAPETIEIYKTALETINAAHIPFLIGGGLAFQRYTNHPRNFHDLDIFCKAGDYPKILQLLEEVGFSTLIQDEKWIAKASKGEAEIDFLFSTPNNVQTVDDSWFERGQKGELFDVPILYLGPEELLWAKIYVQDANKFDGPDVYNLMLSLGDSLDWKNILSRMEADWEVLLAAIINYRFVFPRWRNQVPEWLMSELVDRLQRQLSMPVPEDNICRGPLLSRTNYTYAIHKGGFIV